MCILCVTDFLSFRSYPEGKSSEDHYVSNAVQSCNELIENKNKRDNVSESELSYSSPSINVNNSISEALAERVVQSYENSTNFSLTNLLSESPCITKSKQLRCGLNNCRTSEGSVSNVPNSQVPDCPTTNFCTNIGERIKNMFNKPGVQNKSGNSYAAETSGLGQHSCCKGKNDFIAITSQNIRCSVREGSHPSAPSPALDSIASDSTPNTLRIIGTSNKLRIISDTDTIGVKGDQANCHLSSTSGNSSDKTSILPSATVNSETDVSPSTNKYNCSTCGVGFATIAAVLLHSKVHYQKKSCKMCRKEFPPPGSSSKISQLDRYCSCTKNQKFWRIKTDEAYICAICGRTIWDDTIFQSHFQYHIGKVDFVCDVCGVGISKKYLLQRHIDKTHSQNNKCSEKVLSGNEQNLISKC